MRCAWKESGHIQIARADPPDDGTGNESLSMIRRPVGTYRLTLNEPSAADQADCGGSLEARGDFC